MCLGMVLPWWACTREPAPPPVRDLNVLFITLDTTRADHLSCYAGESVAAGLSRHNGGNAADPGGAGSSRPSIDGRRKVVVTGPVGRKPPLQRGAKTPHLDALAARGVRFVHATAQVPLTLPSHACMFTGNYPEVHQLRDMGGFVLDPKHLTLAEMARNSGFLTAAFVGSKAVGRQWGLQNGFDVYDDLMPSRAQEEGKLPGVFPERLAGVTTDLAIGWLKRQGGQRFFLWVHYYDPHDPYDPPEPYKSAYSKDPYSGEIAYTDEQVGRLFETLDELKLRERTLVIVMGDHGEGLNDHGEQTHGIFVYDDTQRVPFLMAGPGIPAGKAIPTQVRTIDLLPTVAEYLRLPANPAAQGVSLLPLVERGQTIIGKNSSYAYVETLYPKTYMNWSELRGMRTDRWKFILAPHPELYDLQRDPGERENVIDRYPAEADHLQKKIWEVIGPSAQDQKLAFAPINRETRQELESLGYVSAGTPREIILNMSGPDPKDRVGTLRAMQEYNRAMKEKAFARAARAMQSAVETDGANPLARLYLASAYERMRDWRRAIETYRGAVEIGGASDQILSRLGKAYLRVRDLEKGVEAMEQAGRANPTDLDNFRNLGIAYLEMRRLPDAERAFKAILVQDDRYAAAYNGLGLVAIQRGDAETARNNFAKAIEANPDEVEPLLNLGLLYQKAGNKELALHYFTRFLEKAPRQEYGHLLPQVREAIEELRHGA
ncbi:MAG: sulfatase-like hydrolase/transferase [Acidobacteria bacterium]|nr:sulfatase-like hydrolase/transferase [Acidobacteriota bacterium]